jgi:large subunit ribosomal protein L15
MLDRLKPSPGARRPPKRVGRGPGSGWNKTAGRGVKGQGKRSPGREVPFGFEGGQMPLARRLPKRGFHNRNRKVFQVVNVGALAAFGDGATVDVEALAARGLVRSKGGDVKLLGEGDAPKGLTVKVHAASTGARRKIEEAGGRLEAIR